MVQGQVFLKGAGGERGVGTFFIYFSQALSFLHLEITLPFARLCHVFEEKIFTVTIIL